VFSFLKTHLFLFPCDGLIDGGKSVGCDGVLAAATPIGGEYALGVVPLRGGFARLLALALDEEKARRVAFGWIANFKVQN
jgi:hypothetical protein